ncbi:hypothetical protein ACJX0J_034639, partial [Zea mays]
AAVLTDKRELRFVGVIAAVIKIMLFLASLTGQRKYTATNTFHIKEQEDYFQNICQIKYMHMEDLTTSL